MAPHKDTTFNQIFKLPPHSVTTTAESVCLNKVNNINLSIFAL